MLAAGRETLTEVFDLTFIPLLAGSSGAHTHTRAYTHMHYSKSWSLAACPNKPPQHGNAFCTHTEASHLTNGGSQLQNVAAPTSFYNPVLTLVCMYVTGFCDVISTSHPPYSLL